MARTSPTTAVTSCASTTTCRARRRLPQLSLLLRRPPVARLTRATFSTSTLGCSSAPANSRRRRGRARSRRCPSSDPGRRRVGLHSDNVISITDGQIFLEGDLFYAACVRHQRRHLVSRSAATPRSRRCARWPGGAPRPAQYRALAAFAQFGSDLDKAPGADHAGRAHGRAPQAGAVLADGVEQQVISIWAGPAAISTTCRCPRAQVRERVARLRRKQVSAEVTRTHPHRQSDLDEDGKRAARRARASSRSSRRESGRDR